MKDPIKNLVYCKRNRELLVQGEGYKETWIVRFNEDLTAYELHKIDMGEHDFEEMHFIDRRLICTISLKYVNLSQELKVISKPKNLQLPSANSALSILEHRGYVLVFQLDEAERLNLSILDIDSLRVRSVIRFGKINMLDKIVVDVSFEEEGIYRVD